MSSLGIFAKKFLEHLVNEYSTNTQEGVDHDPR